MYDFRLPDIGEGLAEAEIIEWHVKVGQRVQEGDVIAVVSTDKVNVDLTSPRTGVIAELSAEVGEVVPVGKVFLRIDDGRDSSSSGQAVARAAPAVRRYAAEKGVDIDLIKGSGSGGVVLHEDVDAFIGGTPAALNKDSTGSAVREKLSGARLKAAQTLARAAHTMAISTISAEILADNLLRKAADSAERQPKPFALIAACIVRVLARHPRFNARIEETDNELVMEQGVSLGIAIATDAGLVVPVIAHAEQMSVQELDAAIADLAARGRAGKLDVKKDMRTATFTISNTGGLEQLKVVSTTPIVNHPTAAMLWLSRISPRPWVAGGAIVVANVFSCSIAFDHRYLNGADALAFLNDLDGEVQRGVIA